MSSVAADIRSMEYDVALTLLSLHSGGNVSTPRESPQPHVWTKTDNENQEVHTEETTRLILNCVISSEVEVETSPSMVTPPSFETTPKILYIQQNNDSSDGSTNQTEENSFPYHFNQPKSPEIKVFREIGVQTDEVYFITDSHNNNLEADMDPKMMYERMKMYQALYNNCKCRLKRSTSDSTDNQTSDTTDNPRSSSENGDTQAYDNTEEDPDYDVTMDHEEDTQSNSQPGPSKRKKSSSQEPQGKTQAYDNTEEDPDYDVTMDHEATPSQSYVRPSTSKKSPAQEPKPIDAALRSLTNANLKMNDLVPIGEGHAKIPYRILKHINWASYTCATRKLLTAVFPRSVLASHSLTGKPSPAFPNKPAKKKLNPILVNDIVQTVVDRCEVAENMVRTSITTKCADESKMWRTRQKSDTDKKRLKVNKRIKEERNRENIPPAGSESESD